ncbi:MAG TPA: site-specific integrase [Nitrosopumilaceae archaeon]|nr:site-specific integrase [Nitrosopumilaceae archaeon]
MSILDKERDHNSYKESMDTLSEGQKGVSKSAINHFDVFCGIKYSVDSEEIIKQLQKLNVHKVYDVIQNFVNYLAKQDLTPRSVREYTKIIKGYLSYRLMIPIHAEDLHANVKFPKQLKTAPHRLSKEEVQKIIENASLQRKPLYFFLLSSGVRGEEACSLRKRDFELFNGRYKINLRGSYTKTGMPRTTFISKEAQKYLEPLLKRLKDDDLVFTENPDPIKARINEDVYFHRLREKLDLVARHETGRHEITLHSFRSYFISHCEKINEGLGHALAGHDRYMKVYERYSDKELLEFYLKIEPELLIFDSDEIIRTQAELKVRVEQLTKRLEDIELGPRARYDTLAENMLDATVTDNSAKKIISILYYLWFETRATEEEKRQILKRFKQAKENGEKFDISWFGKSSKFKWENLEGIKNIA